MTIRSPAGIGRFAAGEQPDAVDLAQLAAQGFKAVVNLRQAGEVARAFDPAEEGQLVTSLGLDYVHLPTAVEDLSATTVRAFRERVSSLPGPVYVHCGMGQRAATLALIVEAEASGTAAAEAITAVELQGLSITPKVKGFITSYLKSRAAA